jgi:hypothetical protein
MDDQPTTGTISVKLFATLGRNFSVKDTVDLSSPRRVGDIIAEIGIPPEKVTIMFIDGRHAQPADLVNPGQTLSLFPPIGGG